MSETKCPMPDDVCEQCGYRCAPQPSVPSGEGGYIVRLPDSICEDADEVQSALARGMADEDGNPTVPLVYLSDEMCERAARVFKWVLESDEVAAPPQERVSEAMVEDVRYIVLDRNGRTVGNGYSTAKDAHAYAELCATGDFAFYIAGRPHRVIRRTVTTTDATLAAHQGTEP